MKKNIVLRGRYLDNICFSWISNGNYISVYKNLWANLHTGGVNWNPLWSATNIIVSICACHIALPGCIPVNIIPLIPAKTFGSFLHSCIWVSEFTTVRDATVNTIGGRLSPITCQCSVYVVINVTAYGFYGLKSCVLKVN